MMKKLFINIILPLTIVTHLFITKWWYGVVLDGTDEILYGFPFISRCSGFHTSLSSQYFLLEIILNFLVRFGFWTLLVLPFKNLLLRVQIPALVTKIFYGLTVFTFFFFAYTSIKLDDQYHIKRNFEVDILTTGMMNTFGDPPKHESFEQDLKLWREKQN